MKVNVNLATCEELEKVPQIGRERANNIVRTRDITGYFHCAEDLRRVPGFGPRIISSLCPFLSFGSSISTPLIEEEKVGHSYVLQPRRESFPVVPIYNSPSQLQHFSPTTTEVVTQTPTFMFFENISSLSGCGIVPEAFTNFYLFLNCVCSESVNIGEHIVAFHNFFDESRIFLVLRLLEGNRRIEETSSRLEVLYRLEKIQGQFSRVRFENGESQGNETRYVFNFSGEFISNGQNWNFRHQLIVFPSQESSGELTYKIERMEWEQMR